MIVLAAREGNIHIKPKSCPRTNLFRTPSARKEGPIVIAMNRDVQYTRVVIEDVLGPIPMMNILYM